MCVFVYECERNRERESCAGCINRAGVHQTSARCSTEPKGNKLNEGETKDRERERERDAWMTQRDRWKDRGREGWIV